MSGAALTFNARFRKREGSRLVATTAPAQASHTARLLALAHFIDRQVQTGVWKDYREAARRMGICHARVSQITGLLMVPASMQADVLLGRVAHAELTLRRHARSVDWRSK